MIWFYGRVIVINKAPESKVPLCVKTGLLGRFDY